MTRILAATLLRPIIGNTYQPLASAHRLFTKSSVNCDHYDTLKIPRNATQSEIVSAYKQLTDVIKAERNADNAAETYSKLRKIEAAYNVLSNYELRKLYNKGFQLGNLPSVDRAPKADTKQLTSTKPQQVAPISQSRAATRPVIDKWTHDILSTEFKFRQQQKQKVVEDIESENEKKIVPDLSYLALGATALVAFGLYLKI